MNEPTAKDLNFDLTGPCKDCPFAMTTPLHEGIFKSLPHYVSAADMGLLAHTCHKTDPRTDSEDGQKYSGPLQHCGGLLTMMAKDADLLGYVQVKAQLSKKWDPKKMNLTAPVWGSFSEMIKFYYGEAKKMLAERKLKGDTDDKDNGVTIVHIRRKRVRESATDQTLQSGG